MILLLVSVFLGTLGLLVGGYILLNRGSLATAEIARRRLLARPDTAAARTLLKDTSVSDLPFLNRLLSGRDWIQALQRQLERAGSELKPGAFVLLVVTLGLAGTLLGARMESSLLGLLFTVAGWAAPIVWLKTAQRRRVRAFENQLPDAIDMLVNAMKTGYSFQAGTQFVGDEMTDPLGGEFARFYDEQRLGVEVRTALLDLQDRVDSLDLKMFVTAVLIQRETGGNLGEVLSNIADLIRQRMALRGQIQALVAEPKLSAKFLAALPVLVFLLLSVVNPRFLEPLLQTFIGQLMMGMAAVGIVIGYAIMMKIADVEM